MRRFNITVNGINYEVDVQEIGSAPAAAPVLAATAPVFAAAPAAPAAPSPKPVEPAPAPAPKIAAPAAGGLQMKSPMPGTIMDIKVASGASVKKGTVLLILEAMKMENEITAPRDGVVAQISVNKGASVNTGELLLTLA